MSDNPPSFFLTLPDRPLEQNEAAPYTNPSERPCEAFNVTTEQPCEAVPSNDPTERPFSTSLSTEVDVRRMADSSEGIRQTTYEDPAGVIPDMEFDEPHLV